MVDTVDSKSAAKRRGGSIPLQGIKLITNWSCYSSFVFNKRRITRKAKRWFEDELRLLIKINNKKS